MAKNKKMSVTVDGKQVIVITSGKYEGTLNCVDESDAHLAASMLLEGKDSDEVAEEVDGEWTY